MQNRDKIPENIEKYVRIEVIINVLNITRLSDARNTSVQVSDIALFNLEDSFEDIHRVIKDETYAEKIAYKDNENKPINVLELLRLLYAFDIKNIRMTVWRLFRAISEKPRYLSDIKRPTIPAFIKL